MGLLKKAIPSVIIIIFSFFLFVPNLSNTTLFDWDEINFAEAAREMIVRGDYSKVTINFLPFEEKPPLFFWLQAISMHIFGINEFSARLPNAIIGFITLLTLFIIGKHYWGIKFSSLWTIIYAGSILPQFYFMMGLIDPVYNYFIFLGIYFLFRYTIENKSESHNYNVKRFKWLFFSGSFIGLAVLTKGPVAILIFSITFIIYWIIKRKELIVKVWELIFLILTTSIIPVLWLGYETILNGTFFIKNFILYQLRLLTESDAGHGGPFYYHFLIILIGLFPASIFAIMGFRKYQEDSKEQKYFHLWMLILLCVVLILFSIVKTKIVHYSSLAYFPVTFFAAYYLKNVIEKKYEWKRWVDFVLLIMGFLLTIIVVILPILILNKEKWIHLIKDNFAVELIMKPVNWNGFETAAFILLLIGIFIFLIIRNKVKNGFMIGVVLIFILNTIGINISIKNLAPKIDLHLQKDIVEFYKSLENRDVYCDVLGFKSYAQLFYTYKKYPSNKNSLYKEWLLSGNIDKPVYFVSKSTEKEKIEKEYPKLKFIKKVGGYVVFLRVPENYQIQDDFN